MVIQWVHFSQRDWLWCAIRAGKKVWVPRTQRNLHRCTWKQKPTNTYTANHGVHPNLSQLGVLNWHHGHSGSPFQSPWLVMMCNTRRKEGMDFKNKTKLTPVHVNTKTFLVVVGNTPAITILTRMQHTFSSDLEHPTGRSKRCLQTIDARVLCMQGVQIPPADNNNEVHRCSHAWRLYHHCVVCDGQSDTHLCNM